ncbi:MAG TPA: hypothetical protein PKY12_05585 [Catalimonadaceae bacterium]|nr:hypothetical protein [Catalimonadaceae bacterium]
MEKQEVVVTLALEGWIEEFFLPAYLQSIEAGYEINFTRDKLANPSYGKSVGKYKNLTRLLRVAETCLQNASIHKKRILLIFGVDCEWEQAGNQIITEVDIKSEIYRIERVFSDSTIGLGEDQKVLFVPIRSFDTWIWYLKNPKSGQNSFENMPSKDLKKEIYPDGRSSRDHSQQLVEKLKSDNFLSSDRLNHLCTQSPSFAHFHHQIIQYLEKNS